jgi:hypothetical protein
MGRNTLKERVGAKLAKEVDGRDRQQPGIKKQMSGHMASDLGSKA